VHRQHCTEDGGSKDVLLRPELILHVRTQNNLNKECESIGELTNNYKARGLRNFFHPEEQLWFGYSIGAPFTACLHHIDCGVIISMFWLAFGFSIVELNYDQEFLKLGN